MDMNELGVWDPLSVKEQTLKTAIEVNDRENIIILKDSEKEREREREKEGGREREREGRGKEGEGKKEVLKNKTDYN